MYSMKAKFVLKQKRREHKRGHESCMLNSAITARNDTVTRRRICYGRQINETIIGSDEFRPPAYASDHASQPTILSRVNRRSVKSHNSFIKTFCVDAFAAYYRPLWPKKNSFDPVNGHSIECYDRVWCTSLFQGSKVSAATKNVRWDS